MTNFGTILINFGTFWFILTQFWYVLVDYDTILVHFGTFWYNFDIFLFFRHNFDTFWHIFMGECAHAGVCGRGSVRTLAALRTRVHVFKRNDTLYVNFVMFWKIMKNLQTWKIENLNLNCILLLEVGQTHKKMLELIKKCLNH